MVSVVVCVQDEGLNPAGEGESAGPARSADGGVPGDQDAGAQVGLAARSVSAEHRGSRRTPTEGGRCPGGVGIASAAGSPACLLPCQPATNVVALVPGAVYVPSLPGGDSPDGLRGEYAARGGEGSVWAGCSGRCSAKEEQPRYSPTAASTVSYGGLCHISRVSPLFLKSPVGPCSAGGPLSSSHA